MFWEIIVISILGTLFHFTYDLSNHNKVVALFSAVNESTWEHIKISLSATFLCSIFDGYYLGNNPNYFVAKFVSLLCIVVLMPAIFYGYTRYTKKNIVFVDIGSFYIVIICSQLLFKLFLSISPVSYLWIYLCTLGTFAIFGFYMVVTLLPVQHFIFKDPITNEYGLKGHSDIK